MESCDLRVVQPRDLPATLPATITRLPGRYNFKPHIGRLANGDIVMFVAHTHAEELCTSAGVEAPARSLTSHVVMYRSTDEGRSWGQGRHIRELIGGHEPSVSVIDGVLFVKAMIHGDGWFPDPHAQRDHSYAVVVRSTDHGESFTSTVFDETAVGAARGGRIETSRNIHQLPDGRLYLGVGVGQRHRAAISEDAGASWRFEDIQVHGVSYEEVERSCFCEAWIFSTPGGRLMMLSRVDYGTAHFVEPLPGDTAYTGGTGSDNFDGEILMTSPDGGASWKPVCAVGFPTLMYPSVVQLDAGRMLLTYTVREIPPRGFGAIHPHVGLQAIVAQELEDGRIDFDFSRDVVVIDDCTPASMRNAGCFGNTLHMPSGAFLTPFSYPLIDPEILELADRREYLKEEVFDYWASTQTTYAHRFRDIVREDDPVLSELHLRRHFSALFLYGQAANKGGIGTAVVRWELPSS